MARTSRWSQTCLMTPSCPRLDRNVYAVSGWQEVQEHCWHSGAGSPSPQRLIIPRTRQGSCWETHSFLLSVQQLLCALVSGLCRSSRQSSSMLTTYRSVTRASKNLPPIVGYFSKAWESWSCRTILIHDAYLPQEVQEAITLSFICQEYHDPTGRCQRTLSHKGVGKSTQAILVHSSTSQGPSFSLYSAGIRKTPWRHPALTLSQAFWASAVPQSWHTCSGRTPVQVWQWRGVKPAISLAVPIKKVAFHSQPRSSPLLKLVVQDEVLAGVIWCHSIIIYCVYRAQKYPPLTYDLQLCGYKCQQCPGC